MKKISRLALLSCVLLGGSPLLAKVHKQNKFYVVPLETESFKFDSVDIMGGNVVENRFDIGMDKKFHLLRIYNSNRTRKRGSFGNFTNQFDKRINMKVGYKKERIASSLHKNPKLACEYGWEEIASELFLGKLEGLHASFDKTNKLCNVYDEYDNLKTTLVIKNKKRKKPISNRLKLLSKADGTEVLFYKQLDGSWENALNAPITFSEIDTGYKLVLDNGDIERYNHAGRLEEMQSEEKIYTLYYKNRKLVKIADNFQHEIKFRYNKKGLIKKVVSYDDTVIKYSYAKSKRLKEVIYPDNRTEKYVYNDEGKLIELYRDNILMKSYSYDDEGRVERFTGIKESNPKTITYDKSSIDVEENGMVSNYNFLVTHSQAKIDSVFGDEGTVTYAYDNNGQQLAFTDTIGVTRLTEYDKNGLLKEETDNAGTDKEIKVKRDYDESLRKITIIQKSDMVTYNVYDDKGKVTYKVDTLVDDNGAVVQNKIEHTQYNEKGLIKIVEAGENRQTLEYDARGNTVQVEDHLGGVEKVTAYNKSDLPVQSVDSDGEVTKTKYDITGKILSQTKDGKTTSTMKYDKQSRLIEQTSSEGVISYFKYDDFGNIIETSESTGEKIVYTYDAQQNLLKTEKYNHGTLVYKHTKEYDDKRRVTAEIDAYGNRTTYTYNEKGQKIQVTDTKGRSTYYEYDELGKLAKETDPNGGEISYEYDVKGHTTKVVTPNGATFMYTYDGFGRLVEESNPDRGVTTYVYDAYDKLLSQTNIMLKTNAKGDTKRNIYDDLGRMTSTEYDDSSLNVYYTYNSKSEITKVTDVSGSTSADYDGHNIRNKTQNIDTKSFTTKYTYTDKDKKESMIYPSGARLNYTYNGKGEVKSLSLDGKILLGDIHLKNGTINAYTYVDGSRHSREYELNERATKLIYPHYTEALSYDEVGSIISIITDNEENQYAYDILNRLSTYDKNATAYQYFTYDENGNRLSIQQAIEGMTNYIYDDAGNIVEDGKHTYSYDGRNRLVGVDDNVQYEYNYENQRVSKTVDGVTTYYVYDEHKLLGEYDAQGSAIKEYIYLDNTPIAVVSKARTYMIYTDHLNTPRRVVDENGIVVWSWESSPYGETTPIGSFTLNLRFPGQYYDAETTHHYNINRDYNPVIGRYIQSDPVGFKGGVNTYAYAEGNPVIKKDENGLWTSGYLGFPKVHQRANAIVFGYGWIKNILDSNTVAIDRHQAGYESYLHAMRGLPYRGARYIDSYTAARVRSENFVINGMWMARSYLNRGDVRRGWANFGWVLHTMQDSSSPAHRYFQIWRGNESYWTIYKHARKEWSKPSNMNHPLYRASRWIHHMYHYRLIPRHGAIFNFFN